MNIERDKTAVVFGGNGAIGSELVRQLALSERKVRAVVRKGKEDEVQNNPYVTSVGIDYKNDFDLQNVLQDSTDIYYTVASLNQGHMPRNTESKSYRDAYSLNVALPRTIQEYAADAGAQRVIYISSIAVYGRQKGNLSETSPLLGNGIYSRTKRMAEQVLMDARHRPALTIVRPANVLGPGADVWTKELFELSRKKVIPANGEGQFPLVDIRDVAQAMILSAKTPQAKDQIYNLSSETLRIREIVQYFQVLTDVSPLFTPAVIMQSLGKIIDQYAYWTGKKVLVAGESLYNLNDKTRHIDNTKVKEDLGVIFRSRDETMRDSLLWLNDIYHLGREESIAKRFSPSNPRI